MKFQSAILWIGFVSAVFSSSFSPYQKQSDGILLFLKKTKLPEPRLVRIQFCKENIVHVMASPSDTFSSRPSLIVEKTEWDPISWNLTAKGNTLVLSTDKLSIHVQKKNGQITFYNSNGDLLLEERELHGKTLTPAEVLGEKTYHIRTVWNSPPEEAFYGLGAHQNAIMNYKGHNLDLWQYNIVDVVPFLVSHRGYGVLWDNYSRTKFGDIREYQPLSDLLLYDQKGKPGGLTVEYFHDSRFESPFVTRIESRIEHAFIDVNDPYPEGFPLSQGAIRWSGKIASKETGVHEFRVYGSSYLKMWLNDTLVVDSWRQNWLPWAHFVRLYMEKGKQYPIRIEWIPNGGYIALQFLPPPKEDFQRLLSLYSEVGDQIDYYFIYGKNLDEVIQGYRELTGRASLMPKWAMGFWQSRERYRTEEELLSVVREFRKRKIPLDNIVQDWFYWPEDKWGDHDFDPTRFPDPKGMIRMLHEELHTKIMISVWPKFYVGTKHFEEFKKQGWLYMRNVEKGQKDWVGPGYVSTFYDPYSEGARELFWKQIEQKLFCLGIDAWWLDCTEPDIQSNFSRMETVLRQHPTAMGSGARYLNTYSLMQCKAVYEGHRKADPDRRTFILTRSAFAGQQKYPAATWSGDLASRWYDLKAQIPAGLNFSLSGLPYWTTDIGGFAVEPRYERPSQEDLEEWRELNTRWFQFGTFCPIFRVHGQYPYREMFHIAPEDHPAYQSMVAYTKLRYRLMPYIYSLVGMVTYHHYTLMRALVMDFPQDPNVLSIGDQFLFGPFLLVNPVTEYKARSRSVYLPSGANWYDFKTGKYFSGGQTLVAEAPYTDIPIFVKAGAILPCGPEIQYTDEKPADPLRLFVYTGANGSFLLYEDDGTTMEYEKGAYTTIPLIYDEAKKRLTIGERTGKFQGMLEKRTFEIIWITPERPRPLDFDQTPDTCVLYQGEPVHVPVK